MTATATTHQPVIKQFEHVLKKKGLTQEAVARQMGISQTRLNLVIRGKYPGKREPVLKKMDTWLKHDEERDRLRIKEIGWVSTKSGERVQNTLRFAHVLSKFCIIFGAPGLGKTIAARHYAATNLGVKLITIAPSINTIFALYREILKAVTGGTARRAMIYCRAEALEALQVENTLLIVDEAQHLSQKQLEELRYLWDQTGMGLVLMGNESVYSSITGAAHRAEFAQLFSRVSRGLHVPNTSRQDVVSIAHAWGITNKEMLNILWEIASKKRGGLRTVTSTIEYASVLAKGGDGEVTTELLRAAFNELVTG